MKRRDKELPFGSVQDNDEDIDEDDDGYCLNYEEELKDNEIEQQIKNKHIKNSDSG